MKNYVLIQQELKQRKNYGDCYITYVLYENKKCGLVFIGSQKINTGMWGGEQHTAMRILKNKYPSSSVLKKYDDFGYKYFEERAKLQIISY